jgi:copper homeostasis protein CutC
MSGAHVAKLIVTLSRAFDKAIELIDDLRAEKVAAEDMQAAAQLACKIDGLQIARHMVFDVISDWSKGLKQ